MKMALRCIVGVIVLAVLYWSFLYFVGILTYLLPVAIIVGLVILYFRYRTSSEDTLKTPGRKAERQQERAAGRELRGMERKIKAGPGPRE